MIPFLRPFLQNCPVSTVLLIRLDYWKIILFFCLTKYIKLGIFYLSDVVRQTKTIFRGGFMNYTFEEIEAKIILSFVKNGEKKMEGMIYYDSSLKSFLWCGDLRSVVLTLKNTKIEQIKYFKVTKRDGLKIE